VHFFNVTSLRVTEGIANLNATASARRLRGSQTAAPELVDAISV